MNLNRKHLKLISNIESCSKAELLHLFQDSYLEDRQSTLQTLFYIRDSSHGYNRKYHSRIMLKWLYDNDPKTYHRNLFNIVTIGRWDDLFYRKDIISGEVLDFIKSHFNDTLLRKSLPRESVNSNMARHISQLFGMTMKEYRLHSRTSGDFINTLYRPIPEYNVNLS